MGIGNIAICRPVGGLNINEDSLFLIERDAHAEPARTGFHAASSHQSISRLEDVQRARHPGIGKGADKDRDLNLGRRSDAAIEKHGVKII